MTETEIENNHESERKGEIRAVMSFVLVLAILLGSIGVGVMFAVKRVAAEPSKAGVSYSSVVTTPIEVGSYKPMISSEGVVQSRREVRLAAEVSGRIVSIDEQLIEGGTVREGDVLATIENVDYVAALKRAEQVVVDAKLNLEIEEAKQKQARKDWEMIKGKGVELPSLVGRELQVEGALARLASAQADRDKAEKDMKATVIRAPFSGRIREAGVEVGAVVIPGSMVAEIYSNTELEVRLPFSLRDFGLVPEGGGGQEITLKAQIGQRVESWPAVVDRIEGEVERSTLSGYAIARVRPSETGGYPKVGLFVRTDVSGTELNDVVEVPRQGLRGSSEVWVVTGDPELEEGLKTSEGVEPLAPTVGLALRTVEVVRTSRDHVVVRGNFEDGDRLVLTRLSAPVVGMRVIEVDQQAEDEGTSSN